MGTRLSAVCDYNVAQYKIRTFANQHVADGEAIKAEEGAVHQLEFHRKNPFAPNGGFHRCDREAKVAGQFEWMGGSTPFALVEAPWSQPNGELDDYRQMKCLSERILICRIVAKHRDLKCALWGAVSFPYSDFDRSISVRSTSFVDSHPIPRSG